MKSILFLFITLTISKITTAQIVPFNYTSKQEKKSFITIPVPDTAATGLMQIPATLLSEQSGYNMADQKGSSFLELSLAIKAKAYEKEQFINRYYGEKTDSIAGKIAASNDAEEILLLQSELAGMEQQKKNDLQVVKLLYDLSKAMMYKHKTSGKLRLFPVSNSTDAQLFYNNEVKQTTARFLKNSYLFYSPDGGKASIYNEIYSDYAAFVRVGVGALISNKQNYTDSLKSADSAELQKDAVQRLLGGGGNLSMNLSTPIFNYESNFVQSGQFCFKLIVAPRFSFDVPKLGTVQDEYAFHFDAGFEGSVFYTLRNSTITFFGNYRFGYIVGNSPFYANINKDDKKPFYLNSLSAGIALSSTFRVHWNFYYGSSFVKANFPSTIGFSIVPN